MEYNVLGFESGVKPCNPEEARKQEAQYNAKLGYPGEIAGTPSNPVHAKLNRIIAALQFDERRMRDLRDSLPVRMDESAQDVLLGLLEVAFEGV